MPVWTTVRLYLFIAVIVWIAYAAGIQAGWGTLVGFTLKASLAALIVLALLGNAWVLPQLFVPLIGYLIWTQGVYVHMQRPVGPPPHRFADYAPRGRERVLDPAIVEAARTRVSGKRGRAELEPVHSHNCRTAFGDRQSQPSGTNAP